MRRTAIFAIVFCLIASGGPVLADEAAPERWRFTNGEEERVVDVSVMPDFVRAALVERLAAQGFSRADAPRSRDLEADVRELVRHGGRLPRREAALVAALRRVGHLLEEHLAAEAGSVESARTRALLGRLARALRALPEKADADAIGRALALPDAAPQSDPERFLGARGVLETPPGADAPRFRLAEVPPRSVAAAIGLQTGDALLSLDGRPPSTEALRAWAEPPARGGKLSLRLQRKQGRIEPWELAFVP